MTEAWSALGATRAKAPPGAHSHGWRAAAAAPECNMPPGVCCKPRIAAALEQSWLDLNPSLLASFAYKRSIVNLTHSDHAPPVGVCWNRQWKKVAWSFWASQPWLVPELPSEPDNEPHPSVPAFSFECFIRCNRTPLSSESWGCESTRLPFVWHTWR